MNIPDKVKIGGLLYTVNQPEKVNDDSRNCDGKIFYDKTEIQIMQSLEGDYKDYVFLHELTHGFMDYLGWKNDEDYVDRLARLLHMFIKDNPSIFK